MIEECYFFKSKKKKKKGLRDEISLKLIAIGKLKK